MNRWRRELIIDVVASSLILVAGFGLAAMGYYK